MLSTSNIDRLIAVKRREIEKEKIQLGLSRPSQEHTASENNKENANHPKKLEQQVRFSDSKALCDRNDFTKDKEEKAFEKTQQEIDPYIPADLERFIRRCIGLPVMLKAGEYSPNNPLVRGERAPGDALLGLGEYERRRNTLRKIRQQQYREYLDQQAKKKQEAKEQAERERREREQREKEREERERELLEERNRFSPERRRSLQQQQHSSVGVGTAPAESHTHYVPHLASPAIPTCNVKKVDTGVQVDGFSRPLSVAVQTDETALFRLSPSPTLCQLTQAERELSPRSVHAWPPLAARHATHATHASHSAHAPRSPPARAPERFVHETQERRRSYGDFDERGCLLKKCNRDKLTSELRHTYMPSIFDADAIRLRNMQAEKEAAERRQFYQQELKNQIMEQQRIREERKNREKMLEQAEMRRLEEQLRMLRAAQDGERGKQHHIANAMKENAVEYNNKRSELQREIDAEQQKLLRAASQPTKTVHKRSTNTSKTEALPSKLPFYYPKIIDRTDTDKKPYSINIQDNSIFSSNYDVDSYLRKNLNFNKDKVSKIFDKDDLDTRQSHTEKRNIEKSNESIAESDNNVLVEKALIHERPEDKLRVDRPKEVIQKQPSKKIVENVDCLPIPVLRHSPTTHKKGIENTSMSEAMKKVDDKWKVPAVQKNILKALPDEEGKSVSILTQLGSIRRQLQLEQLKLDKMHSKDDEV